MCDCAGSIILPSWAVYSDFWDWKIGPNFKREREREREREAFWILSPKGKIYRHFYKAAQQLAFVHETKCIKSKKSLLLINFPCLLKLLKASHLK